MTFVEAYLRPYLLLHSKIGNLLDMHVVPQADHLWPIDYHKVLRMETLLQDTAKLFGESIASQYFSQSINATSGKELQGAHYNTAVADLKCELRETGCIPQRRAYLDDDLESLLR